MNIVPRAKGKEKLYSFNNFRNWKSRGRVIFYLPLAFFQNNEIQGTKK